MSLDWTDKVDGIDDVNAEDVNQLASGIEDLEANPTMHPYIGENGNWYVWNAVQENYIDTEIAATGLVEGNVINSLDSDSATDALSARMGKELKGDIIEVNGAVNELTETAELTLLNGWEIFGEGISARVNKSGNIATIYTRIKSGITTTGTIVASVPSQFAPSIAQLIPCFSANGYNTLFVVNINGTILIGTDMLNSTDVIVSASYVL